MGSVRIVIAAALAALVLAAPAAAAELPLHVFEEGGTAIRLMPGACAEARIVAFVVQNGPQYAGALRAIESTWQMQDGSRQDIAGCWFEIDAAEGGGEELVVLLFADGDRYVVPKASFKLRQGAAI